MGMFKSKEQKTEEAKQRAEEYTKKVLANYGLDIENYDEKTIKDLNVQNLKQISVDLAGTGIDKVALMFNVEQRSKLSLMSAQVRQNWIIIRQNEIMIRLLEQIVNPKK